MELVHYNYFMKKVFVLLESLIYVSFIVFDLLKIDSTYIKYLGIVLCFLFAFFNKKKYRTISMFFTLIADLFLLVLNKNYEVGVASFIIVQTTYMFFEKYLDSVYFNKFIYIRFTTILVGTIILYLTSNLTLLNELVLIYFSSLLFNTIYSYSIKKIILALGLTLFVCCDICVGIHNINVANNLATFLMWFFYLPSQVLIVMA